MGKKMNTMTGDLGKLRLSTVATESASGDVATLGDSVDLEAFFDVSEKEFKFGRCDDAVSQ